MNDDMSTRVQSSDREIPQRSEAGIPYSEIPVQPQKKGRRGIVVGIVAVAAAIVLLPLVCSGAGREKKSAASTSTITVATVEKRIEIDGKIVPTSSYSLAFPIAGSDVIVGPNIAAMNVSVGDQVGAGQILAQLEGDDVDSGKIRAPVDGVITSVDGAAGAPPPPGATIQMRTLTLEGEFLIGETDLATLTTGTEATVTIPVLAKSVPVTIGRLPQDPTGQTAAAKAAGYQEGGAVSTQGTASYALMVPVPAVDGILPGLTARLLVIPQRKVDVLVVPAAAVLGSGSTAQIEISVEGRRELRTVQVGISDGRYTEIVAGAQAGEEIILNPAGNDDGGELP